MLGKYRYRSKILIISAAVLSAVTLGLLSTNTANAYVQDCDGNAIMYCGAGSPASFITKAKANSPGDLQNIYAASGLSTSEYSRFAQTAQTGTVYKSGSVVVNGQTVMTNAWSFGRHQRPNQWYHKVNGKTYYASYTRDSFVSNSLPAMVMFDKTGKVEFAAINSCGNPVAGKTVVPKYSCDLLEKTAVAGKKDTYSFTTKASASNNARIAKYVYNFGDGTTATTTSGSTAVEHAYTNPGDYNVTVTVYVNLPGKNVATAVSAKCKTTVTVAQTQPKPSYQCVSLFATILNKDNLEYRFTATTRQSNGATLESANFDFGDGVTSGRVLPVSDTSVQATHTYDKEGKYTITATVSFSTEAGLQSVTCETSIDTGTTPPPVCALNPALPANSPECVPCKYDSSLPKDSPKCVAPVAHVLPNTGAGSMFGLFFGTSIAGTALYRWRLTRKAF